MKTKIIEKLFGLAYTDSLTELPNRTAYEEHLKKLRKERAVLDNITVIAVDIDDLKFVNEMYGYHTGDEALRIVANNLKRILGDVADIYRIGSDNFICIANKEVLSYVAQFMDFMSFENRDRYFKVNVSVGYALFNPKKHKSIDDLIKTCDVKMYQDKKRKNKMR